MNINPNVIFVFGDQWRAQATGYAGDPNVKTPNLDALSKESLNFTHALAGCPVCSPYRASLLTGQRPLTHGVFLNDVCLRPRTTSIAQAFTAGGYDTAYVGKWHVDGHGRSNWIPPDRRLGFDYWKVLECTHDYNKSPYYAGSLDKKLHWNGYDALAQTRDAQAYVRSRKNNRPFFLVLSWGPPHNPYHGAPEAFRNLYNAEAIELRPNVPAMMAERAKEWLAGYYAHCSALDACVGDLLATLRECGIENDTVFVFTSDHGDMLGSQGHERKQRPWDESIRVPFLIRYPGLPGWRPRTTDALIDAPDIMPTLLGLCDLPIPDSVEGTDFSAHIAGDADPSDTSALIMCAHPFGEFTAARHAGREYRGLRTRRYTYVRGIEAPWLLYDNEVDPCQMRNLISDPEFRDIRDQLDDRLQQKLDAANDRFERGIDYVRKWNYPIDENGTVPYTL